MTRTKRKRKLNPGFFVTIGVAAALVWALLYYVLQIPLFDRSGWAHGEQGSRYLDYYGKPQTGWLEVNEKTYYLNPDTAFMHTGWLETEEGRYYLGEDGVLCAGWLDTAEGRYYLNDRGMAHTGWLDTPEGKNYFDETGRLCTGWQEIEEKTYYLTDNGTPHTGWLEQDGERYYFLADGKMAVGQVEIDGVNHFFTEKGKNFIVVNPWNSVPKGYDPQLVMLEGFEVSAVCRDDLLAMMEACRADGHVCVLNSTYRSINLQQILWDNRYYGYIGQGYSQEEAHKMTGSIVAYPGTSEHHLGLAVDIIGTDEMYQWFKDHSWEYGFHPRYPEDKTEQTGIIYEPWHFRYLGKELAQTLYEKGLTVEEYITELTNP